MKKLFSLITAFVLCTSFVSAKTIYCKMAQDWWKVDNAAVGCHSWETGTGTGTTWPGVRMTPVEGETDLWSIDLNLEEVQNVIFTRVNPSDEGDFYWGAKTKDLQIPTDDKNLFTITTSEAVWGDPGCEGEWSVYSAAPAPEVGEQFEDATSGLKFEVTAVGDTNSVKVIKSYYTETSYTVPSTVKYNNVTFTVTEIGLSAFDFCESLTSVTLPTSIKKIDYYAFSACESLQSVTLSEGLTTIAPAVFSESISLQSITIPASVKTIGQDVFYYCSGLTSVTFLGNACQDGIDEDAFYGVGEDSPALLTLPDNWTGSTPVDNKTAWYGGYFNYTAPAARKEFVFVAGEAAEANPAMFAITWGKDGSNETVKMTQKGEEALYTANILETVDSVVLVRCASDATEIIWDGEGKNVWNQTANYELCDTMSFVAWVEETNLFAIKCDTPEPVETKYYAKNNWDGGEWSWKEMSATDQENVYMLDSVVFGGTGVNINDKEDDTDALYFAAENIPMVLAEIVKPYPVVIPTVMAPAVEEPQPLKLQAGDTIVLFFNAADTTLQAGLLGRPAPAARKEFVFVAGEAADSDPALFAITWGKDGSNETVKLANKADDIYTAEILETVDSVVLVRCASDATEIIWDGEGKNVWNQTANYALCDTMYFESWVEETNLFAVTCEAPKPVETKYYAKNNWNGGEWSWLEMSATDQENVYMLDSVVFGGTGVNINDKEDDTDALYFAAENIPMVLAEIVKPYPVVIPTVMAPAVEEPQPLKLQAGDTIVLFFNAADTTIQAGLLGRPAPAARKEFVFVAGEAAEANPAMFAITWGKDGSNETVKMTQKGEEALYTANILETVDSVVLVRCASDATEIIWDGEGKNVWNQTANYALCDTMYFESWVEETNLFAVTCEAPKPVETKYYAKNNWNGGEWLWKEMSATNKENIYMLDSVVFGGGENAGININSKADDTDAFWFDIDHINAVLYDGGGDGFWSRMRMDTVIPLPLRVAAVEEPEPLKLQAGDTIMLFFNIADTTLQAGIYGRLAPVEPKFYVTGNAALVGEEKAWQADAIEMVDYTHTFPMLAAGEYQLKVTDGTWDHAWGYDNLSPTVAVEGLYTDVDGNICFTVYTPNDVTVTFAQGYVIMTGDFTNPTPATPDFGLLVNGTDYLPGTPEDKDTYTEYAVNTQLAIGEFVQLYDNVNKAAWTVTPEGSGFTDFEMKNDAYYIKQTGLYQFYIKIPKEGMESGLYVGFQGTGTNLNKVKAAQGQRFNVLGLPVNANYRGIVIMNGQTYLQ